MVDAINPGSRSAAIISLILGLSAGALIGWLFNRFEKFSSELPTVGAEEGPNFRKRTSSIQPAFGLIIVGLFLGWQSVPVVGSLWWVIYLIASTLRQESLGVVTDLPDIGPGPKQENAFSQDIFDNTDHGEEQQITSDRSKIDSSIEQAAVESKSEPNWATQLATLPHAWLLAIVLIHLSTWRWMNLIR